MSAEWVSWRDRHGGLCDIRVLSYSDGEYALEVASYPSHGGISLGREQLELLGQAIGRVLADAGAEQARGHAAIESLRTTPEGLELADALDGRGSE